MSFLGRILFPKQQQRSQASRVLFRAIMTRARASELYADAGLPDTFDGRFHAVTLYAALIFPRLERAGEEGHRISSGLNKRLFDSFDAALRETGVGDASIARKIRSMGEEFFGIGKAVQEALQSEHPVKALADVLERNSITDGDGARGVARRLADDAALVASMSSEQLIEGRTGWESRIKAQ